MSYRYHPLCAYVSSASMSSSCTTMNVSGVSYKQCDGAWFKPFYDGGNLQYEVVASPY